MHQIDDTWRIRLVGAITSVAMRLIQTPATLKHCPFSKSRRTRNYSGKATLAVCGPIRWSFCSSEHPAQGEAPAWPRTEMPGRGSPLENRAGSARSPLHATAAPSRAGSAAGSAHPAEGRPRQATLSVAGLMAGVIYRAVLGLLC
jgi:hypothetical protein